MRPRKHEILDFVARTPVTAGPRIVRDMLNSVRGAEEFVLDALIPWADVPDLLASAEALHEHGVFSLPYPVTMLQIPFKTEDGWMGDGKTTIMALMSTLDLNEFFNGQWWGSGLHMVAFGQHNAEDWVVFKDQNFFACRGKSIRIAVPLIAPEEEPLAPDEFDRTVMTQVICAITLLHTRGVRKERILASEKLNKCRLKNRKTPINDFTVIRIQEHIKMETERGPMGERHRTRLHTRRAHRRLQPYGPGRSKKRWILIASFLVGYEEEGKVTHDHYEVDV
jgi:hypothetical protein